MTVLLNISPVNAAPMITLNPTVGSPGSSVTIMTSGFTDGWQGKILWDGVALSNFKYVSKELYFNVSAGASAGKHTVKVCVNCGGGEFEESASAIFTVEVGSISVSSNPSDASIFLNGSYKGTTPLTITNVAIGSYNITLELTGYQDWSQTIDVVAGQTSYLTAPLTPTTGEISVSSNPSDASIFLNGNYKGTTNFTIPNVAEGSHNITLRLTGYHDWSQTIDVAAGQTSYVTALLTQIPGSISVSSNPSGASIFLNGSYQGTTNFTIPNVAEGSYNITLELTGYHDWSQTIYVVAGQTSYLTALLTPTTGSISLSSNPSGASIFLNGGYQGTTNFTIPNVAEGSLTITLRLTGYQDWSQTIDVAAGQTSTVTALLTPTTGKISISSNPSGASIYLDESYQGTTPFTINNVEAGSHTIKLELTGYLEWSQTIDVAAGQTSPVTAPLTQIPILEIIIAIFGISVAIFFFYIFMKPPAPAPLPPPPPPPEGHLGGDKGEGYPEDKKAAALPLVGKVEEVPVLLAVSAPEVVKPGDIFTARLAAYIKSLEEEVKEELIRLSRGRSESYMGVESCRWKLDTHVTVRLSGKHLKVDPSESEFVWKGERNLVNFLVEVLADAPEEWTVLRYEVFIEGIRVAFIPLDLEITSSIKSDKRNIATIEPAHTAFASYASQDRVRVLDRVAAVRISAGLDIFMDCLSIHPGEEWKPRLEDEIKKRDIFLLFWSANAKNSEWVTWEWKMALVKKEESALQLHPLQTVTEAPPPEELKKFHFGDVYMIVRNAEEK